MLSPDQIHRTDYSEFEVEYFLNIYLHELENHAIEKGKS
jgi:hypothetical protein